MAKPQLDMLINFVSVMFYSLFIYVWDFAF
jgi:hypothetical protein